MRLVICVSIVAITVLMACNNNSSTASTELQKESAPASGTYAYDASFLRNHTKDVAELKNTDGARVLISADYQGRVMTSTAGGDTGRSYGWMNYSLIASHKLTPHMNAWGGEERFWIGPEGGQYSFYFKPKDSFVVKNWQVPGVIDSLPFQLTPISATKAKFTSKATLNNYVGTSFEVAFERTINLLSRKELEEQIHINLIPEVKAVAYQSDNLIRNTGIAKWQIEKGLMSIWLLSMMKVSNDTKIFIPFKAGQKSKITTDYFGTIPPDRLRLTDSLLVLKADGKFRSKVGLAPAIASNMAASFDFANNVLSVIIFPVEKDGLYMKAKWEIQKDPYKGDVVNAYNDGPMADSTQLGPFYELESTSPVKVLDKGETLGYHQLTCHFEGSYEAMKALTKSLLNVDLDEVKR
jgi:hypothetical protein